MHGRKREDDATSSMTDAERALHAEKIAKYNAAKAQLLHMRAARVYDEKAYALTAKLIELNPDFYTLFNYRKEIVLEMVHSKRATPESLVPIELDLSTRGLERNPKCYGAWVHRLWCMDVLAPDEATKQATAQKELALCTLMLTKDARNFHCWNYRRACAARAKTSLQEEFDYTTTKINENFSNYSAWHYRTKLIPRMYDQAWMHATGDVAAQRATYDAFLDGEFQLVSQAFFTEPEDQSAWLYHRWLLGRVVATGATNQLPVLGISLGTHLFDDQHSLEARTLDVDCSTQALEPQHSASLAVASATVSAIDASASLVRQLAVFTRERALIADLLEIEPQCKWALLTQAILLAGIIACHQQQSRQQPQASQSADGAVSADETATYPGEIARIFDQLLVLDPMRANYYRDVRRKFAEA